MNLYEKITGKKEVTKIDFNFKDQILEEASVALRKLKLKEKTEKESAPIEESFIKNKRFSEDDLFELQEIASKKLKIEESVKIVSTEKFSEPRLIEKLEMDMYHLNTLSESITLEENKNLFNTLLKKVLTEAAEIHREANITPRSLSLGLSNSKSIEENEVLYNMHLKKSLEENFRKPLLSGELLQEHAETLKNYTNVAYKYNLEESIGKIDPKELGTFIPFMEIIESHILDTLLPTGSRNKLKAFLETQNPEYGKMPGNALTLYEEMQLDISKIASLLAPALFKDKVDLGDDNFDGSKYTIIKIVADNKDALGSLKDLDPDDDNDGIPDDIEDHGELPDDFDGDHDDAELDDPDKDNDGVSDDNEDHGKLPDDFNGDHDDAESEEDIEKPLSPDEVDEIDNEVNADLPEDLPAGDDIDPEAAEVAAEDKSLEKIEDSKK